MAKITDRDAVRFVDKDVRIAVKRLVMNYQGKRLPKELRNFLKYKRRHLDDPWRFKGVDDDGNKGTWKKNADSTALKKFGKTLPQMFRRDRDNALVKMAKGADLAGGGVMEKKKHQLTNYHRTAKILEMSGAMRKGVRVSASKMKAKKGWDFIIKVLGSAKSYAYFHLHGHPTNRVEIERLKVHWNRAPSKGKKKKRRPDQSAVQRMHKIHKNPRSRSVMQVRMEKSWRQSGYPARPWGAWTPLDIKALVEHIGKDFKKTMGGGSKT